MSVAPCLPGRAHQLFNTVLSISIFAFIWLYFRHYVATFPITIESIWQISLAEINRRKNIRRIQRIEPVVDEEKGTGPKSLKRSVIRHMASVVGYREEPILFRKCLQSYRDAPGLEIMLVGIDGDHAEDMEMVAIAGEVINPRFFYRITETTH
jgi:hyaluronan synthase